MLLCQKFCWLSFRGKNTGQILMGKLLVSLCTYYETDIGTEEGLDIFTAMFQGNKECTYSFSFSGAHMNIFPQFDKQIK